MKRQTKCSQVAGTRLGMAVVGGSFTHVVLSRWLRAWGATAHEQTMSVPGDELIPAEASQQTMVVKIAARPDQIWPWLVQMGIDRAGFYSWLWVENGLMRLGANNADEIHPEWQELKVGDIMAFMPEHYPGGRKGPKVIAIEPERSLVLDSSPGAPAGTIFATWQFLLTDGGDGSTRLVLRTRSDRHRPLALRVMDGVLQPGYLLMNRAMLLGIKSRAERMARQGPTLGKPDPADVETPAQPPLPDGSGTESVATR